MACLFIALQSYGRPIIHRDLIHLVMYLKTSTSSPLLAASLQKVSKTKIRGVIAIFKQGELVSQLGNLEEAVQLSLDPTIDSIDKLRERHDKFLQAYMVENLLHVPEELLGKMVWQVSAEEKQRRFAYLDGLTRQLEGIVV